MFSLAGDPLITKLMLEHGARKDSVNSVGRNAAQMAAFVGEYSRECNLPYSLYLTHSVLSVFKSALKMLGKMHPY